MNVDLLPSATPNTPAPRETLFAWVGKARYVTISAFVHALLLVLLGGTVLIKNIQEPPDFEADPGGLFTPDTSVAPPQQNEPTMQQQTQFSAAASATVSSANLPSMSMIATNVPTQSSFAVAPTTAPNLETKVDSTAGALKAPTPTMGAGLSKEQASKIGKFTGGWAKGGTGSMGKPLKSREFEFTAYLAKYKGGDWDSTVWLEADQIIGGSLPNLLFVISKLSRDKIKAHPQAVPLDLASEDIFNKRPPFIWFTGHRDFVLTNDELVNLAEYLRSGGCIWGDSSLPGERSRFDIAFRREMERVLQELNPKWQKLPPNHPIFTKAYYPEIRAVPPGINFYDEPVYALTGYGGEIAVLYTANDYGDMWQFGIDQKGNIDLSRDEKHRMVAVNEHMWHRRNLYFRNIEPKALFDTYKFGTNIIVHLLTRWEDKLRNVPRM